jgi:hypothetical protein
MLDASEQHADHLKLGMIVRIVAQHSLVRGIILGDHGVIRGIDRSTEHIPIFNQSALIIVELNDSRRVMVTSNMIVEDDEVLPKDGLGSMTDDDDDVDDDVDEPEGTL